jgi:hypothetical protein
MASPPCPGNRSEESSKQSTSSEIPTPRPSRSCGSATSASPGWRRPWPRSPRELHGCWAGRSGQVAVPFDDQAAPTIAAALVGVIFVSYPRAGSYVAINTPVFVVMLSTSRSDACVPPANSRRPAPSTRGAIISRYSSIRSAAISAGQRTLNLAEQPVCLFTRQRPQVRNLSCSIDQGRSAG